MVTWFDLNRLDKEEAEEGKGLKGFMQSLPVKQRQSQVGIPDTVSSDTDSHGKLNHL